jgi:hypothetical protein
MSKPEKSRRTSTRVLVRFAKYLRFFFGGIGLRLAMGLASGEREVLEFEGPLPADSEEELQILGVLGDELGCLVGEVKIDGG